MARCETAVRVAGSMGYSARTVFHLTFGVSMPLFEAELAAFAAEAGAGPTKQIVLILDRGRWHAGLHVGVPEHLHLLFLPPHSPELLPAKHLWKLTNMAPANRHFASIDELEEAQVVCCFASQHRPALIRSATRFA